ncbi:acetyl-CoA carboxylase, carboxyl transferase, beta subunit [Gluconacetobacter diazotrophicus PA1 5]|uniref:Acetyl-coenzyme A carboxylase carboxyl transferase subunit beta n=2 Tax=Gluconacetobacter diazotrophicus TaxID=33996 RepID=ACCD_GLUDA|nr:acetyl-CoA carboxylase, carboxyltransferase subunit beta [Gluconacetobacter diazotrophicus]A9HE81.2 RecName: Full=Acetyl-coenzyme A carboxylase carboxyl transferase subunit beta; Short=ACCase subunit beta; Short=Acetyl-CoA carboxylase carboxyltransferase subunit beta [Gluconacetobacter diazotrophicus PA1 5]ACI51724.1 acetyl-CoA carboxylase, carboxyl transferase, beta subunit [Gluconacetobacter diazotrophicus PA1 5]MBB2155236.1 acetyl-CoA carboxylase carboxyltransferase subunit beta [Gluconace
MSWLTEYVRPKIRGLLKREVPDNLWTNCESCSQMILVKDLQKAMNVCPHCGHHMRASVAERFGWTFDEGTFTRIELPKVPVDPLSFRDRKRYTERLKDERSKSQLDESMAVAHGRIGGHDAVVAVMAFEFIAGTMGAALGEAFLAAARLAILQKAPLVVFTASGGARMQEGMVSLMQMPRTTVAVQMLRDAGLPYIVVLTNPTTGGVTASFAMLGDVQISEPNALIGFAGQRVIEDTVREKLPEGFQRAEYLLDHGMIDMVVKRPALPEMLGRLIGLMNHRHVNAPGAALGGAAPVRPAA